MEAPERVLTDRRDIRVNYVKFSKIDEWNGLCEDRADGEFVLFVRGCGDDDNVCIAVDVVDGHGAHEAARASYSHGRAAFGVKGAAARTLIGTRHLRAAAVHHHRSRRPQQEQ